MPATFRVLFALLVLACAGTGAHAQGDNAILLVAHPELRDADYRETVIVAAPAPNGGHFGVILNRPTKVSLQRLFPEHAPSKLVAEPVFAGGPFSRNSVVAVVRAARSPGVGSVPLMPNVYMAFRVNTIDRIIETRPNDARYYVGYVSWRPGELDREIDRGLWAVLAADPDTVFRKDTRELWEELLAQSRRLRAQAPAAPAHIALARKTFSAPTRL